VIRTIWPNSEGCFWCHKTAFSRQERIFLKTKKADQKHCENWRVSLVQNSTNIPECASEVSGENSCEISSLKVWNKPTLAQVPFQCFFGLMESLSNWRKTITFPQPCVLLCFIKPILGNRYVRFRGFIVSEPRVTVCVM
jgi:hypothetical protein